MATAAVTLPGGAGASGVIPCPLPATVEDAICAVQKTQPGEPFQTSWGVFISHEGLMPLILRCYQPERDSFPNRLF